jgi:hypothetical protein
MPPPELVWGIFTRLLGVVYLIAFVSLFVQITTLVGERGITPVGIKLATIRRDIPGPSRYWYFPTLFWFGHSDRALKAVLGVGIAAALAVVVGGPASFWGLLVAYVVFLSFDFLDLSLPWECVLFEAGILALFMPATHLLPELTATAAPEPALTWAYRILLFRVVFGFGKFKFMGSSRRDLSYLHGFLINQPLPTVIAWYSHHLPLWVLRLGVVSLFFVEIPGAIMALIPGVPGLIGGAGILGLMVVIHLCGNFGYFNWIVGVLCVAVLDSKTPLALDFSTAFATPESALTNAFVALHTLGALMYLPFNSYVSHWHHWPLFLRVRPRFLTLPVAWLRLFASFRWLQSYGVFPPKSMAPVRNVAVVEVSYDGEAWHELEYANAATRPEHRPCFMAPHVMRWEQLLIYETYGTTAHALAYSVNLGQPWSHAPRSDAECLLQRILEGRFYEGVIFKRGTFPRPEAPRLARMRIFMLEPTTPSERKRTGHWWTRSLAGPHYAARALDPHFWQLWLPEPDLFDFDDVVWKRRTRLGRLMDRAARARGDEDLAEIVLDPAAGGQGLSAQDLERFWDGFLPLARPERAADWQGLYAIAEELAARYSSLELRRFERLAGRIGTLLDARLDPYFCGDRKPVLDLPTHYHLALFCQALILRGKAEVEAVFRQPETAHALLAEFTLERGMYLSAVLRLERLVWESRKIRLLDAVLARSTERFPDSERARYERDFDEIARKVFGIAYITPVLRARFSEPEFGGGMVESYPDFIEHPSGMIKRNPAAGG